MHKLRKIFHINYEGKDYMHKVEITGVDTSKLKTLSNDEMNRLLHLIKDGDLDAREKMIKGNLKLVLSLKNSCVEEIKFPFSQQYSKV